MVKRFIVTVPTKVSSRLNFSNKPPNRHAFSDPMMFYKNIIVLFTRVGFDGIGYFYGNFFYYVTVGSSWTFTSW